MFYTYFYTLVQSDKRMKISKRIERLKKLKNAVVLAHSYTNADVQNVADFIGDSLGLSRAAVDLDAEIVVFAGVHFMAESAAVLSPEKKILLPVLDAGCPMADMITSESLRTEKKKYPDAAVVCYVNSSADVKAESDICCTSSNAVKVVESLENDKILFVPDKNLAAYVASKTNKKIIYWNGYCPVHDQMKEKDVQNALRLEPKAKVLAHPECNMSVLKCADEIFSTAGILNFVKTTNYPAFIIGTENGIMHQLKQNNPDKKFIPLSQKAVCADMKKITVESIERALIDEKHRITVPENVGKGAKRALDRMLDIS